MCLSNRYFPLVKLPSGKQRILFKKGVVIDNRDSLDKFFETQDFVKNEICNYKYMDEETGEFVGVEYVKMVSVPCGMCRECLTQSARDWSFRILKEAEIHEDNYFITLTYDDDHIPSDRMLDVEAIKNFNKKLKVYLNRKGLDSTFRFYGVGEYGGQTARPHYHVIYFGLPIPDLKYVCKSVNGDLVFDSNFIRSVWANGNITIEGVSIGSAAYVARYCDKKKRLNKLEKQELKAKGIVPEFSRMSNRPGIGAWFLDDVVDRVSKGLYESYVNGKSYSYPLYYNRKMKEILKDTDVLDAFEANANLKSGIKISRNLMTSDAVGSLARYNDTVDKEFKSKRKL